MPEDWKDKIGGHDAIFFGAVGWPAKIPDHISLWGSLILFRREFDQYVNLRPVRLMPGVPSPLANRKPGDIDFWVVRENTEGEYSSIGGRIVSRHRARSGDAGDRVHPHRRRPRAEIRLRAGAQDAEEASDLGDQVERHRHHHAVLGRARRGDGEELSRHQVGQVPHRHSLRAVRAASPTRFNVVVASNLFGDILSDLGPACTGTIGIAPSGNINPERKFPSVFEPVHGSAPDIAGQGIANPIGQIWSGAMMLEHLGEAEAAAAIVKAIEKVLAEPKLRTRDLGGAADTVACGKAVAAALA